MTPFSTGSPEAEDVSFFFSSGAFSGRGLFPSFYDRKRRPSLFYRHQCIGMKRILQGLSPSMEGSIIFQGEAILFLRQNFHRRRGSPFFRKKCACSAHAVNAPKGKAHRRQGA